MNSPVSVSNKHFRFWLKPLLADLPNGLESALGGRGRHSLIWLLLAGLVGTLPLIITPLPLGPQAVVAAILIGLGLLLVRLESQLSQAHLRERVHLLLVWLSIVVTLRYLYYRTFNTLKLDNWLDGSFSLLLYGAELYAIATLLLAYFQTLKLRQRQPVDLGTIPADRWPAVDIYIPTYNEAVEIVRKTAVAALAIDYPDSLKQVYILDDGRKYPQRREQLRAMCQDLGCQLMVRDNNDHAKAGNINHAMRRTGGSLILILDCDHIPSRTILQRTVGFFLNPKVSLVQTPHWFYNPDPFERNLLTEGQVPVGNELFYKVLQKGNDFWNAAFFCGSAAVVRKSHLLEVGGIAVETVTEDCHTSLRLHMKGYETVYYDHIMVAGLAPETFSAYVGQQVRWARGMAQILRLEMPLFNRRLSLPQRLCYTSATTHFFFGFPRLMYAIAPLAFLLFGINSVRGLGLETLSYALPSILLALNANYITYKEVRFSFWNEIFEYAMAFQDGIVTLMALINPRLGSFNVTDKGLNVARRRFDWASVRLLVIVGLLSLVSLFMVPYWLVSNLQDSDAVLINAAWCLVNLLLLSTAVFVALEQPQLRRAHRLDRQLKTILRLGDSTLEGITLDISETGARIRLPDWPNLADVVELEIWGDTRARAQVTAQIVRVTPYSDQEVVVAVTFDDLTPAQHDALVLVLYSDVEQWNAQARTQVDRPLTSLQFLANSLVRVFREPQPIPPAEVRKQIQSTVQLYVEGYFLNATAEAIGSRSLRVVLQKHGLHTLHPEIFSAGQSVGLLAPLENLVPLRLITEVRQVTETPETMLLELGFPGVLQPQQGQRINVLLNRL